MFWIGFVAGYIIATIVTLITEYICIKLDSHELDKWMEDDND